MPKFGSAGGPEMTGKPAPLEVRRRRGRTATTDSGGRPLLSPVSIHAMATNAPEPPESLGVRGAALWRLCWDEAVTWLSVVSDLEQVMEACEAADMLVIADRRYAATSDPADARAAATLAKRKSDALAKIGFTPTDRGRLGVAEVKAAAPLEHLLQQQRTRNQGRRA